MKRDAYYRTHVRSRRHAHRRNRVVEAIDAASLIVILAIAVVVVPLLFGKPTP